MRYIFRVFERLKHIEFLEEGADDIIAQRET